MRKMRKICLALIGLLATTTALATAAPKTVVVCYPGGAVTAHDANKAIGAMLRALEQAGQWPEHHFTSTFTTKAEECRQHMAEKKPKFAITSLGLYLELRDLHQLLPVAQPKINGQTSQRYRVIARKDSFQNLDELAGKTLGGTVLEEPQFIGRVVFSGHYDPARFFVIKNSNQAIRALRALDKSELDAVILNEQQFAGLASLPLKNPLEVIFTSEAIPLMGVVANSATTTVAEREQFGKALEGLCANAEGKQLCGLFGIEAFQQVDAAVFAAVNRLWSEGR